MMAQFTVSAPGKVILYGEHAVVYGKTAVAASLDLRTTLMFRELPATEENCYISFAKLNLNQKGIPLRQVKEFLRNNGKADCPDDHDILYNFAQQLVQQIGYSTAQQKLSLEAFFYILSYIFRKESFNLKPFEISLTTNLSISSGLGSSASFAVCLAATFLNWSRVQNNIQQNFDEEDLNKISRYAYVCEKLMHGNPSGIDNSICTYGSMIEFRKGEDIKLLSGIRGMKILLVDTRVQRSTKALLHRLADLKRQYPAIIDPILNSIDNVSKEAIDVLKRLRSLYHDDTSLVEEYRKLMVLINVNQGLLATCQVSHPSLDRICAEAHNYGLAAKLTGAGGGGYAYILLMPDTQPETISSISRKLIADGYSVTLTSLGCDGITLST